MNINTGSQLKVYSPYNSDWIDSIDISTTEEIESWISEAYKLSRDHRRRCSRFSRIEILKKVQQTIQEQKDEWALLICREGGKPLIDSQLEVERAIQGISSALSQLEIMAGNEIPLGLTPATQGRWAFTRKEPVGVVLAFSAFNHPLNLVIHQMVPAIAVGCPILVKPASQTPLSCLKLIQTFYQCGLSSHWCRWVICDHLRAESLVRDSRLSHFMFIGSSEVGWKLKNQLAPGVTCSLEHGGAAPVIMMADADFDHALPLILKGSYYHAGQVCVSIQRIFVHESKAHEFAEKLSQASEKLKVGDPLDPQTQVGPLIHSREVKRVEDWVSEAVQTGASLLSGGKNLGFNCFQPTVLFNPPEATRISRLEVFGPVVAIYPFKNLNEAINRANQLPFCFQSSVFTQNLDMALKCIKELDATTVLVNDHSAFRADWMPFGGRRQSGVGVGGIPYTMKELTYEKLMIWQSQELFEPSTESSK